jgi:hypothetical protein
VTTPATTNDNPAQGSSTAKARREHAAPSRPPAGAVSGAPRVRPAALPQGRSSILWTVVQRSTWRFYVCVGCLILSAATMEVLARWFSAHLQKAPVELIRPLAAMDARKLLPEYELHPVQPETLSHEAIETLGTEEYLTWNIVDLRRDRENRTCVAHLFISYYTGKPDMVPHVPEECIQAGGQRLVGRPTTEFIHVPGVGAPDDQVAVRVCQFELPRRGRAGLLGSAGDLPSFYVLYFFHVNGTYCTTRNEVRLKQSNLFDRYAYYAKVEVRFTDYELWQSANRPASLAATGPLLRKIMPIVLEDHLADWEALTSGATDHGPLRHARDQ